MRAILLVTGSRAYPGRYRLIYDMVERVVLDFAKRRRRRDVELVLMHGDCPDQATGRSIDQVASVVGMHLGFTVLPRPVQAGDGPWPAAGQKRNRRMVNECVEAHLAGDVVEVAAFPHGDSRGTYGCLKMARGAGLGGEVWS